MDVRGADTSALCERASAHIRTPKRTRVRTHSSDILCLMLFCLLSYALSLSPSLYLYLHISFQLPKTPATYDGIAAAAAAASAG